MHGKVEMIFFSSKDAFKLINIEVIRGYLINKTELITEQVMS